MSIPIESLSWFVQELTRGSAQGCTTKQDGDGSGLGSRLPVALTWIQVPAFVHYLEQCITPTLMRTSDQINPLLPTNFMTDLYNIPKDSVH